PPAAATTTITPTTGLVDAQRVTATVTGAATFAGVQASQCLPQLPTGSGACESSTTGSTNGAGPATLTFAVEAVMLDGTDCREVAGSCSIQLSYQDTSPHPVTARTPLTFDAAAPLAPPPVLSVAPADQLRDGQVVHVTATGLVWGTAVDFFECTAAPAGATDCDPQTHRFVSQPGTSVTFDVQTSAMIITGKGAVDCRTAGACVLAMNPGGNGRKHETVTAPLAFDASVPITMPTIAIAPDHDLVDGQTVRLTGSGL